MTRITILFAAAALVVTGFTLAMAAPVAAQAIDSKACTEQERGNQTLSEKLGQSNGVICPPDVDSEMTKPAPDAGKTPVIPPPGSPGGNPNVQPKQRLVIASESEAIQVGLLRRFAPRNDRQVSQITYCRSGG
jgi:hypothetical protein